MASAFTSWPMPVAARCSTWIATPTVTSSSSQNGMAASMQAHSIQPIICGVERTGGNSAPKCCSVCSKVTRCSTCARLPAGMGLGMNFIRLSSAGLFVLADLLAQVTLVAELVDLVHLRLQPVDVLFLIFEQAFEEFA